MLKFQKEIHSQVNKKEIIKCSAAYLNSEYVVKDLYVGVTVIIGKNGIEKIVEINLSSDEKKDFDYSIDAVKDLFRAAKKLI